MTYDTIFIYIQVSVYVKRDRYGTTAADPPGRSIILICKRFRSIDKHQYTALHVFKYTSRSIYLTSHHHIIFSRFNDRRRSARLLRVDYSRQVTYIISQKKKIFNCRYKYRHRDNARSAGHRHSSRTHHTIQILRTFFLKNLIPKWWPLTTRYYITRGQPIQ